MENAGITVSASDVNEAAMRLCRGQKFDWLVIEPFIPHGKEPYRTNPVTDFNSAIREHPDFPGIEPTVHFTISWNGLGERFTRKVSSIQEMYAVIAPLFHMQGRATAAAFKQAKQFAQKKHKAHMDTQALAVKEAERVARKEKERLKELKANGPR